MADPLMTTVATALATWGATALADTGRAAMSSLLDLVRARFRRDPATIEIVEAAIDAPDDDRHVARLADLLGHESAQDPAFGEQLRTRWLQVAAALTATHGGVANSISGDVTGSVVQARDVHGGVSFGAEPPQRHHPGPETTGPAAHPRLR